MTSLDLGFIPSPSGAAQLIFQGEEDHDALLLFQAMRETDRADLLVLATFHNCVQSVFGYPNDEAGWDSGRHGVFRVDESTWAADINLYNQKKFPARTYTTEATHYFVSGHDRTSQFLATNATFEVLSADRKDGDRWHRAITEALGRLVP